MRDTLFLLRPGFTDQGGRWFCPFAAQVRGMLYFFPELEETLEIVEIDFPKPRQAIVDLLGEEHQSTPILVLHADRVAPAGVPVLEVNGHRFVETTMDILRFLAASRELPLPHP